MDVTDGCDGWHNGTMAWMAFLHAWGMLSAVILGGSLLRYGECMSYLDAD